MAKPSKRSDKPTVPLHERLFSVPGLIGMCVVVLIAVIGTSYFGNSVPQEYDQLKANVVKGVADAESDASTTVQASTPPVPTFAPLDIPAYNAKLLSLANYAHATTSTSTLARRLWPVKTVYPNPGALLPFKRIVAYYGNLYSTQMGVLGEYPAPQMLSMLNAEVQKWQAADPATPVVPALDYIAVTAQGSPGADGKYRLRMPASQIDQIISLAAQAHGIIFLDVQLGLSNVQTELPLLEPYLKLPQVHLALDPEFAMHNGQKPGTVIGTMDATDINYAANYLAKIVKDNNLPPKILVVHRFTEDMVTNYQNITPLPDVQIVMDMDGWGTQAKKLGTYNSVIYDEPVQFTGFKLFYKNDVRSASSTLLSPAQILKLIPQPSYIQFQ